LERAKVRTCPCKKDVEVFGHTGGIEFEVFERVRCRVVGIDLDGEVFQDEGLQLMGVLHQ
jgi:hypothetical protein